MLSPWIDADLGIPADEVFAALEAQTGRRVIKTHTPLDGFPDWDGVSVITVYRHPLDVFFSLRKHYANMTVGRPDDPMRQPLPASIKNFLCGALDREDYSSRTLESVAGHYVETLQTDRRPRPAMLHYADMMADRRRAVAQIAEIVDIEIEDTLLDVVLEGSSFGAMKAKAAEFAPAGGTGLFKTDAGFFDSARSQKWLGQMSQDELDLFEKRLADLIPDASARAWLQYGNRSKPTAG
jgi:hypothetical protein